LDSSGSGHGLTTGSCEHDYEPLDSVKDEFLDELSMISVYGKGLFSRGLVIYISTTNNYNNNNNDINNILKQLFTFFVQCARN
jgi:hypothetical protein